MNNKKLRRIPLRAIALFVNFLVVNLASLSCLSLDHFQVFFPSSVFLFVWQVFRKVLELGDFVWVWGLFVVVTIVLSF